MHGYLVCIINVVYFLEKGSDWLRLILRLVLKFMLARRDQVVWVRKMPERKEQHL